MEDMDQLYRTHAKTVYKFLLAQCHNEALAEELTQETFYQAVKSINRFDGSCKVSVWLCQIAKHLWYQHLRKHKREIPSADDVFDQTVSSAEDDALIKENHLQLLKTIHELPDPAREVVYLRTFGGLSFKEIGDVLGKTLHVPTFLFYRVRHQFL